MWALFPRRMQSFLWDFLPIFAQSLQNKWTKGKQFDNASYVYVHSADQAINMFHR